MKRFLGMLIVALVAVAPGAWALPPIEPSPITPGPSNVLSEQTVQEELIDSNAVSDLDADGLDVLDQVLQSTVFSCPVGTCDGRLIIEQAGLAGENEMGLYDLTDPTNRVVIFVGSDTAGTVKDFEFDGDGSLIVDGFETNVTFGSGTTFGLYIENSQQAFFQDDSLNPSGRRHVLIFYSEFGGTTGSGQPILEDSFVFAFEDRPQGHPSADFDYNDFMYNFQIEQTPPPGIIPEPASMLLFGLGGIGAVGFGRRKKISA